MSAVDAEVGVEVPVEAQAAPPAQVEEEEQEKEGEEETTGTAAASSSTTTEAAGEENKEQQRPERKPRVPYDVSGMSDEEILAKLEELKAKAPRKLRSVSRVVGAPFLLPAAAPLFFFSVFFPLLPARWGFHLSPRVVCGGVGLGICAAVPSSPSSSSSSWCGVVWRLVAWWSVCLVVSEVVVEDTGRPVGGLSIFALYLLHARCCCSVCGRERAHTHARTNTHTHTHAHTHTHSCTRGLTSLVLCKSACPMTRHCTVVLRVFSVSVFVFLVVVCV